jgi:hypothetical protein
VRAVDDGRFTGVTVSTEQIAHGDRAWDEGHWWAAPALANEKPHPSGRLVFVDR